MVQENGIAPKTEVKTEKSAETPVKKPKKKKPIIQITDVKKVFKIGNEKVRALNGVSVDIYKGEFVIILGTSGSGKSTFLNVVAGLEKPTKGSVKILGEEISTMSEVKLARFRQRHIGFIFQSYNLMPTLTAVENVALPLTFRKERKDKRLQEAAELLKAVSLGTHLYHKPTQMSGGQQQRVGIARAFAGTPEIIFADEPTGNLDSKTSNSVLDLMMNIARKNNQTIIMVTHDPSFAERGDKIVYLFDGKIREVVINEKNDKNPVAAQRREVNE